MNKEISLKKFSIFLSFALIIIAFACFLVVINTTPLCKVNNKECKKATCTNCQKENNQTICDDCNIFDEDKNRIWTGNCIFN